MYNCVLMQQYNFSLLIVVNLHESREFNLNLPLYNIYGNHLNISFMSN